jgi:hypothetical protein
VPGSHCARVSRLSRPVPNPSDLRVRALTFPPAHPLEPYTVQLSIDIDYSRPPRIQLPPQRFRPSCFNDLQTLFPSAPFQSGITPSFSFACPHVCTSRKSANIRSFVFLHLHTLFHSFTKSDSPFLLFSVACAHFAKKKQGVYIHTPLAAFPHPSGFGYNLPPWPGCRFCFTIALSGSAETPTGALNFNEVPG